MNNINIKEIQKIITEYYRKGYKYFGVRSDDIEKPIGHYFRLSRDIEPNNQLSIGTLSGTSCTGFNADDNMTDNDIENMLKMIKFNEERRYSGDHQYIVCGEYYQYGDDPEEIIIDNSGKRQHGAKCIYKIR